jgi:hypothetical protein
MVYDLPVSLRKDLYRNFWCAVLCFRKYQNRYPFNFIYNFKTLVGQLKMAKDMHKSMDLEFPTVLIFFD